MATYAVVFRVESPASVNVGALGALEFQAGYYIYVGQARRGFGPRLARHFRRDKRLRWHVDYLGQAATPVEAWAQEGTALDECVWAEAVASLHGARRAFARFGASDCRCPGHLAYVTRKPSLRQFRKRLRQLHRRSHPGRVVSDGAQGRNMLGIRPE